MRIGSSCWPPMIFIVYTILALTSAKASPLSHGMSLKTHVVFH